MKFLSVILISVVLATALVQVDAQRRGKQTKSGGGGGGEGGFADMLGGGLDKYMDIDLEAMLTPMLGQPCVNGIKKELCDGKSMSPKNLMKSAKNLGKILPKLMSLVGENGACKDLMKKFGMGGNLLTMMGRK